MSGHSGGPAPKKMKQVLLGQWLHQSDGSKPAAVNGSAAPSPARSPHGSGGRGSGSSGGGGGGDAWAKYQAPRGGHRSGSSARDQRSAHSNSSITSGSSYSKGVERAAANHRHSSARGGQAFDAGGGGSAIDLSADDNGDVGKGVEAGAEGGKAEAIPYPAGMGDILEGLCEEQRHVIDLVLKGKSVFFTGAAGTGKSFLLKKLHQALRQADQGATTFMTGTTGKAAVGIGGCTIHSFAGIGLGKDSVEQLVGRVKRSRNAQKRWAQCKVLVIDEISMMEADLFDKLNLVGQRVKGNGQPFGGIQLVLCGDFFQLPPVGIGRGSTRFCFEAKTWDTSIDQSIVLKQVFRQKDPFFLKILHEMREGRVSSEAEQVLADKVEQCRFERYQQVNAKSTGGISADAPAESGSGGGEASAPAPPSGGGAGAGGGAGEGGGGPPAEPSAVAAPPPPPPSYTRLFSRNEDVDRLNVEELQKLQGRAEFYEAEDNGDQMYLSQLQKHCAAGQTIELKVGAKVLLLKNLDSSSQLVNGATGVVKEFVEASGRRLPMVEFDTIEGGGKVVSVISEEEWTVSLGDREMARRVQLPLRLAWALSVHKSQGMTIAHVMVSTRGMFEFGQAYVALSRATTLDGLHLVEFRKGVVKAHESVKKFYAGLERRAAHGGSSSGITAVPRQGKAVPKPGEWISRSSPTATTASRSATAASSTSTGAAASRSATAASRSATAASSAWASASRSATAASSTSTAASSTSTAASRRHASTTVGGASPSGRGPAAAIGGHTPGGGGGGRGGATGMSPAARARMEESRRRALEKLAAKKRAKALETASCAKDTWVLE